MTKLEQLIKELCPNGVEYKKLGDIATDIFRGAGITRDQVTEEGIPCVRYGEIYTTYGIYFDTCVSHTDESTVQSKKYFEHGDILFAITGESVEDIAKSTAYVGYEKCLAGGDIVVLKHKQNPKYLSYVLSTTSAQAQKSKGKVKSKVVHSSVPAIKDIVIPVPPLEVQAEIVKILDEYSTSVTALQQELEKELTARKKQYEYYRDFLLDFDVHEGGTNECEWRTIKEIFDIRNGYTPSKSNVEYWENGIIPWFRMDDIRENGRILSNSIQHIARKGVKKSGIFPANSLIMSTTATIGEHALIKTNFVCNQQITCFSLKQEYSSKINIKFVFYLFFNFGEWCRNNVNNGGGLPIINTAKLSTYKIPIPTIEKQKRIVSILDRFDKLCNDISEGLPAEIEARRKQYEYYRDKLLSFKEQ